MRTPFPYLWSVTRFMALLLVLCPGVRVTAQSAADQAIKTLPQQMKDNGENRVVNKSNTVSNSAMNKLDSAGNKALKGITGIFKKKNKKKAAGDSTVVHPVDTTALPKSSSFIYFLNSIKETYQS
jgi:hypothetical protein